MAEYALECIRCNCRLRNSWKDVDNQPSAGTAFTSYGHYGSTVFDPMDGTFIQVNLCDDCLKEASSKQQVLLGQQKRAVVVGKAQVGWEKIQRNSVYWDANKNYRDDKDVVRLGDIEEFYSMVHDLDIYGSPKFEWDLPLDSIRELITQENEKE